MPKTVTPVIHRWVSYTVKDRQKIFGVLEVGSVE